MDVAVQAAFKSAALIERTRLGCLTADGPDFIALLQRLGSGEVAGLSPGEGAATVLLTAKGRIVRHLTVHRRNEREAILLTGDGGSAVTREHIDRYTVSERTGLAEAGRLVAFALVGPGRGKALAATGLSEPGPHALVAGKLDGIDVEVIGNDSMGGDGVCLVLAEEHSDRVRKALVAAVQEAGGAPLPEADVETVRILRGLPAHGHELTDAYNPLEAGLDAAVSFTKGCYIGQEVVARLNTYDKVARVLRGLRLDAAATAAPGSPIRVGEIDVGTLTSRAGEIGLGYVRRQRAEPDAVVGIVGADGDVEATLVELPFVNPASP